MPGARRGGSRRARVVRRPVTARHTRSHSGSSEKVLSPQLWEDVLTDHGFTVEAIDLLHRQGDDPVVDQLIQARRA